MNATVRTLPFISHDVSNIIDSDINNKKKPDLVALIQTKVGAIVQPVDLRRRYMEIALHAQTKAGQAFAEAKAGTKTAWDKMTTWQRLRDVALEAHDRVCGVRWYERSEPSRKATVEMIAQAQGQKPVVQAIETIAEEVHGLRETLNNILAVVAEARAEDRVAKATDAVLDSLYAAEDAAKAAAEAATASETTGTHKTHKAKAKAADKAA